MKGLHCNEFPGGIGLIQSLTPHSKCCRGFAGGFCPVKGLFAPISDPILGLNAGEQGLPQGVNSCPSLEEFLTLT